VSKANSSSSSDSESIEPIVGCLKSASRVTGYGLPKIFIGWVDMVLLSFQGNSGEYVEALDDIVPDHCSDEDREMVAMEFAKAFGHLLSVTCDKQRPVIGDIYEAVGANSDRLGQHFTPWRLCELTAGLDIKSSDIEAATPDNPIESHDPTCGSGRMLIAHAKAIHKRDPTAPVFVTGVDISRVCAQMAVINLILAGTSGSIIYGDSLTMEYHTQWVVNFRGNEASVSRIDDPKGDSE